MTALRCLSIVLISVAVVGCGGSDGTSESSSQTPTSERTTRLETVTHPGAMDVVKSSDASLTVVNFWATWCVPCVEEFPSFVKLEENLDDRGVDVMFISTDFPEEKQKVVDFLTEHGVTGTSYLKTGNTTEFVNGFSEEWSGAVPATFIYDGDGTLLGFWEGKVSYRELKARVTQHLDEA